MEKYYWQFTFLTGNAVGTHTLINGHVVHSIYIGS